MSIIKLGNPAIPVKLTETGTYLAKIEHIWHSARRWAKRNGYDYEPSYGVVGIAPT